MSNRDVRRSSASAPTEHRVYEPPQLVVLGPVTKFTFGNSGQKGDKMTTKK